MTIRPLGLVLSGAALILAGAVAPASAGPELERIRAAGKIVCLVNSNSPGFSAPDSAGVYAGFNPQFCRMAAAAIFGDAGKADIRGIGFSDSMKTLVAGEADMASRSITETGTRDADPGMAFVATTFFDGQGFMVRSSMGVDSARQLDGATICAEEGSTTLLNVGDWFADHGLRYKVENIADKTARLEAFFAGKCDALSSDLSALAADRLLAPDPAEFKILPEVISNEPLALVSRPDQELEAALFWSFQAMLWAERYGVTSATIDRVVETLESQPKAVQRMFGRDSAMGDMAGKLGLDPNWAIEVIRQVGNYAEVFEATVGADTPMGLVRAGGPNSLWTEGGLHYAYPIR